MDLLPCAQGLIDIGLTTCGQFQGGAHRTIGRTLPWSNLEKVPMYGFRDVSSSEDLDK